MTQYIKKTSSVCVFSEAPDRNYYRTVKVKETVKFPCHTKLQEDVDWERVEKSPKSRKRFIYLGNQGHRDLGLDPRLMVLDKNQSHSLVIYNVTVNDSAYYHCIESSGHGNEHFYRLTVEGELFCMHTSSSSRQFTAKVANSVADIISRTSHESIPRFPNWENAHLQVSARPSACLSRYSFGNGT